MLWKRNMLKLLFTEARLFLRMLRHSSTQCRKRVIGETDTCLWMCWLNMAPCMKKSDMDPCSKNLSLFFHLFDIYFSSRRGIYWSLPLRGSLFVLSCFSLVSATDLCSSAVFSLSHFTPFVFSSCTMLHITTPLPPPSPLFLRLLHLIIHHSQIWLNVLS